MRTEAAAGGGGGGVGAGWDLSAEAGPGPGLGGGRSSDPGSETRHSQGRRCPAGQRGAPRFPPARRPGHVGGPSPASHGNPRLAPRVGRGSRPGSAFLPAPAPSSHKRHRAPAGTTEPPVCSPIEEPGEGKRRSPGGVTTASGAASPSVHCPVRTFSFWDAETGEKQAGSFCARYRPDLRGVLPARPAPCGVSGTTTAGAGREHSPAASPDPLGAASRAPRRRGGCAAPAHGSRSPATLSPCLSFAFPAPLAFEPPPAPGVLSACQLIPFSPEGFVPPRAPARRFPARRGAP